MHSIKQSNMSRKLNAGAFSGVCSYSITIHKIFIDKIYQFRKSAKLNQPSWFEYFKESSK